MLGVYCRARGKLLREIASAPLFSSPGMCRTQRCMLVVMQMSAASIRMGL